MTTVRDVMSKEVVTVEPTATVAEAATMMGAHHVGSALVLQEGRPAGIFTERDILRALAADFNAAQHHISQWMTPDPVTVQSGTDVREARDIMLDRGFRHLPVMDGAALCGVVSLRYLSLSAKPSEPRLAPRRQVARRILQSRPHLPEHVGRELRRLAVLPTQRAPHRGRRDVDGFLEKRPVELARHPPTSSFRLCLASHPWRQATRWSLEGAESGERLPND